MIWRCFKKATSRQERPSSTAVCISSGSMVAHRLFDATLYSDARVPAGTRQTSSKDEFWAALSDAALKFFHRCCSGLDAVAMRVEPSFVPAVDKGASTV